MADEDQKEKEDELPLETVGQRLTRAREAAGISLAEVSARTKIAERQLASIEEDRFADLAGRTYAIGFSKAYARAVGLDEGEISEAVRNQLGAEEQALWPEPQRETFEPGDPARVPPSRLAWTAGLGAVVVIVLLALFWKSFLSPAGKLPDLTAEQPPETGAVLPAKKSSPARPAAPSGEVVFTAMEPDIWVKFYDEAGDQLFQKQMAQGERYVVPPDAEGPQIWTGRPDALKITIGGREVPPLSDAPRNIRDVPVTADALLARGRDPGSASGAGSSGPRQEAN